MLYNANSWRLAKFSNTSSPNLSIWLYDKSRKVKKLNAAVNDKFKDSIRLRLRSKFLRDLNEFKWIFDDRLVIKLFIVFNLLLAKLSVTSDLMLLNDSVEMVSIPSSTRLTSPISIFLNIKPGCFFMFFLFILTIP